MNDPKVSILMPTFNGGKYIAETLDTVMAQTFTDWEIILMDGGSKDDTVAIVEQYAEKHPSIHIYSEPDEGPYHAIHKALDHARGEFVAILCASDGYMNGDWLKMCVEKMESDPEIALVWGIPYNATEDGTITEPHFAYAHLLQGSNARGPFLKEMMKRLSSPSSFMRLLKKMNASNIATAKQVLKAGEDVPEKKAWFKYWLETGSIVPDGNMLLAPRVLKECLPPYHMGTREAGDWMTFFFDVNAKGYLSYCIPVGANYTRNAQQGSVTERALKYNDANRKAYFDRLAKFRDDIKAHPEHMVFRDRAGNVIP